MYQYIRSIKVFNKIALIILIFAALTYVLTTILSDLQYSEQDMVIEYQNIVLYQIMAERWNATHNQKEIIVEDLERIHLSAYVAEYKDQNNNKALDFKVDSLIGLWTYKQNIENFNYLDYQSVGDKDFIADSLRLVQTKETPYASYGFFGEKQIPAIFLEFPNKNNQHIIAYWLILDYPLPRDIDWTTIILPIVIILMLILSFLSIRTFLAPIQEIKKHVKNLKKGTLNSKIPITTNDELGELSVTINKMTEDLGVLVNQKQNLLIDVSHELKTPLTRLKLIVANMKINATEAKDLNKEINFLQDMISNMLLSDKLSTPYIEDLEKKEITLGRLIQNTCDMFYQIEKKLRIINHNKINPTLLVDNYKMSLAIKNLIDNALKYGDSNKLIELSFIEEKNKIKISVKDFGMGILKEQINEISKPLYRGSVAKQKQKSGFGLGLAITKKIVEAHKGELIINSNQKIGSEFVIVIPNKGGKE